MAVGRLSGLLLASLILGSCLTVERPPRPDWVVSPPRAPAGSYYFVSSGTVRGDFEAARLAAAGELVEQITSFVLPADASSGGVEARAALESFQADLWRDLAAGTPPDTAAEGLVAIRDSFRLHRSDGRRDVYLFAECDAGRLEAEADRFAVLFRSGRERFRETIAEAEELKSRGRPYQSARAYLEAAVFLVDSGALSDIENPATLLDLARHELERIRILPVGSAGETGAGRPFARPFVARIVIAETGAGLGGVGLRILIGTRSNGAEEVYLLESQPDGLARFSAPAPRNAGVGSLSIGLDLESFLTELEGRNEQGEDYHAALESLRVLIGRTRAVFPYTVASASKKVATALLVIDRDGSGNTIGRSDTATGIFDVLAEAAFSVERIDEGAEFLTGDTRAVGLRTVEAYGDRFKRLIYGNARIIDFSEKEGKYAVTVGARVAVIELGSGRVLYESEEQRKSVLGNSSNSTITSAYRQLGKMIGNTLIQELP